MCIARTKTGAFKGVRENGVSKWRGIPYAEPPTGGRRFMPPAVKEEYGGDVIDASSYGSICVQNRRRDDMSEDSLTLNIWAPAGGEGLAVMVYVHGGSFFDGTGSDPEYEGSVLAVEGGVVAVTLNYRLGVLGFMDFSFLGEGFSPNCGLLDVVAAIGWVRENIEAFGGDPDNITVFGQSAGAYIASAISLMPEAQGMISKVIMMSGAPALIHSAGRAQWLGREYMDFMNIRSGEELKAAPALHLTGRQLHFRKHCGLGSATYSLSADGGALEDFLIPMAGKHAKLPILIGTVKDEMSFLFVKPFNSQMDMGRVFDAGAGGEDGDVSKRIERAYETYGKRKMHMMMSDLIFRMQSVWFCENYSKKADAWMYRFDYSTVAASVTGLRAFHSTDIPFLFGNYNAGITRAIFWLSPIRSAILRVSREIRRDFTTFAKTGGLPWQKCSGEDTPAKCYDRKISYVQAVPREIKEAYKGSRFRQRCFNGESNDLTNNLT